MKLPQEQSSYTQRVHFGRYVAARLGSKGLGAEQARVRELTDAVKDTGRAWEDSVEPVQAAKALRDEVDARLDTAVQNFRARLAGASKDASRSAPYTQVFPSGVAEYTEAPIGEVGARYALLLERVSTYCGADAEGAAALHDSVRSGLAAWDNAVEALQVARQKQAMAAAALEDTEGRWARGMEQVYARRLEEEGKTAAERYFPRSQPD